MQRLNCIETTTYGILNENIAIEAKPLRTKGDMQHTFKVNAGTKVAKPSDMMAIITDASNITLENRVLNNQSVNRNVGPIYVY
jgi:hypothetical protein